MDKTYAKYMTYGKTVRRGAKVYKLIEDMDEKKDTVRVVNLDNMRRYELLRAWIQNYNEDRYSFRENNTTEDVEAWKKEMDSYEVELRVQGVTPNDKIRFITSDYKPRFEVQNFGKIKVNGKERQVYYLDECHFGFIKGSVYHLCEYAELCERNGVFVEPMK